MVSIAWHAVQLLRTARRQISLARLWDSFYFEEVRAASHPHRNPTGDHY